MTNTQAIDSTRKKPKQPRARHTVDTILDATARILAGEGGARLTTNLLARKSGFSIGTIYQYFPNREAIVLALIDRQREAVRARIAAVAAATDGGTVEARLRRIVHVLHDAFNLHHKPGQRLALALLRMALARGLPAPSDTLAGAIVDVWSASASAQGRALNESEVFVLTRALVEVLRHATLHGSALLGTAEFEEALLRLVLGFLRAGAQA